MLFRAWTYSVCMSEHVIHVYWNFNLQHMSKIVLIRVIVAIQNLHQWF
jgi:hypothetical protein